MERVEEEVGVGVLVGVGAVRVARHIYTGLIVRATAALLWGGWSYHNRHPSSGIAHRTMR